jgi:FkbM family methyltransferase
MKVLYITPHLSTGGAPRYLLEKIKLLNDVCDIYCIEYNDITGGVLVVQRSEIASILGNKLITIGENKMRVVDEIKRIAPDIIHFEEMPEYFCAYEVAEAIYNINRTYKIFETSHDSSFNPDNKLFFPDKFLFVSEYQRQMMASVNVDSEVVEFPITYKKKSNRLTALKKLDLDPNLVHVINIGLFTARKNQKELIDYARKLTNLPVQFHFIGSLADNFKYYWEDAIKDLPPNCKIWGERSDVDNFYDAADFFFFASRGFEHDKETSPLVIKECIGWNLPIFLYNLPVYCNMYNKYDNMMFLSLDKDVNISMLKEKIVSVYDEVIGKHIDSSHYSLNFDMNDDKFWISCLNNPVDNPEVRAHLVMKDIDSLTTFYSMKNHKFAKDISTWILPMGPTVNFGSREDFRGFIVDFYDLNYKFLFSKEHFIRNTNKHPDKIEFSLHNPFDRTFWNYQEFFIFKNIEREFPTLNLNNLETVLDLGANNGIFIEKMLRHGVQKIYGFEPSPNALSNLTHRYGSNDKVTIVNKAVSNNSGKLNFYYHPDNSTISAFDKNHITPHLPEHEILTCEVETIKLDEYCASQNLNVIDLIKIDVEGAEYMILNSLNKDFYSKVKNLLVEIHENINDKVKNLISYLRSCGFEINSFAVGEHPCSEEQLLNSVNGMFLATYKNTQDKAQVKAAIVTDVFFHTQANYDNFIQYATNMRKTNLPILLMTNSKFDSKILDYVDYLIYDKENRLFCHEYKNYKHLTLFLSNNLHHFDVPTVGKQRHGLSVLSNFYRSLLFLKSLGFTHIIKTEADCFIEKPDKILETLQTIVDKNKKGLIYLHNDNGDLFTSYHVMYFEVDFLLSIFPQINNEQDYRNYIQTETFISAEELLTKIVNNKINEIIVRNSDLIFSDYGNSSWNKILSPVESDKIINGCVPNVFKVYRNNILSNDTFAIAIVDFVSGQENEATFIIDVDGQQKQYDLKINKSAGYEYKLIDFDNKPTTVTIIKGDFKKVIKILDVAEIENNFKIS